MEEEFVDIVGWEGLYQVSSLGNVMSLAKGDGNGNIDRLLKQEVLSSKTHTSYRRVALCVGGKVTRYSVHRLVASAFLDNIDNKPVVNHIDNNGQNNTVANLEWCTQSENMQHAMGQGRLDIAALSKLGSQASQDAAIDKYNALIGTTSGGWKATGVEVIGRSTKVHCVCIVCGVSTATLRGDEFLRNPATGCRSCALKVVWETRELKPLDPAKYPVPLVKDLGMMKPPRGKIVARFAMFNCPVCGIDFKSNVVDMARNKTSADKCKHRKIKE